jgi:hypothetical protein
MKRGMIMNKVVRIAMFIAIVAYVFSSSDLMDGPIDDIILMIAGSVVNKKLKQKEQCKKCKNVVEANGYHVY